MAICRSICKIAEYLRRRLGFRGKNLGSPSVCFQSLLIPASIILEGFQVPALRLRTSDNSISCPLSPVSSQLLSHFLYPYPQYSLVLFPFVFPFRFSAFCFSFFRFRHLLCLSYAINLLWSDRGNRQPAMSRMVRHDLSRKKKFRVKLHTEKAKKGSGSAPEKP